MAFDSLIRDAQNFISDQLGLGQDSGQSFGGLQELPWDENDNNESFFAPQKIKTDRWNKLYPYRLLVIDITKPDRILGGGGTAGSLRTKKSKSESPTGGIEYVLTQSIQNGSWEFNLPITPQMLRITDQFAINTSSTMRGIVEEHNGVKYKMINASGTTGIWTQKPTVGGLPKAPTSLGTIFGGSLNAFSNVLEDLNRVKRAFDGSHPSSSSDAQTPGDHPSTLFSTGYYQAMLLGQFLERYAQLKKKPEAKNYRLVFDIPKQNQSFIVTPISFNLEQSQQKPMEYQFSFQLKAWKRIQLEAPTPLINELPSLDANIFQRIVGTIRETRRLLGNSINLIKAVRSDFQRPLNVLRQTSLAIKDLGGLAATAADLPRQLVADFDSAIKDSADTVANSFQRGPGSGNSQSNNATGFSSQGLRSNSQAARAGLAINSIVSQKSRNEGLSQSAVDNGALGIGSAQSNSTDPTQEIFNSPEEYFDLFDAINVEDLTLSREQQEKIDEELERVRLITVADLKDFRQEIESLMLDISNNFGAADSTYSDIYNRPDPRSRVLPMSLEENEILSTLMETLQMYDLLTSTLAWDDFTVNNPLQFVGGVANEAGIDFDEPQSKLLVPVPFGLTIEEIAARYLGDPDKWVEIATLNSLTSPYIDETGFTYELLSNGDGRQINVDDTEGRLFVGQTIILRSDVTPQFSRRIINVEQIGPGNFLVTFDGLPNLDSLATNDNATIQGFLPGTVNSQNQIYIPTTEPAQEDDRIQTPTHLEQDQLTRISKIDFLLDDNGDLAVDQFGDFRLSNGLTNLVQALKLKVRTKQGTLLRHLDFGLGLEHGISVADIENGQVIDALNQMIQDDPRFSAIERIDIRLNGSTLAIDMAVRVANGSGVVPITFDL
jgi:hypothetical protein